MILRPAAEFTLDELTEAYNRTRSDYLIPMPMNAGRMQEYVALYDVDLLRSSVAIEGDEIVGLGMLGLRRENGWITRLGVLPEGRRKGVGSAILESLLDNARAAGVRDMWLEVISGNDPAHELFLKYGFRETRELIVARRPPRPASGTQSVVAARSIRYLQHRDAVNLHCDPFERVNWLNDVASMRNVTRLYSLSDDDPARAGTLHRLSELSGIWASFRYGGEGWVTYQATALQLRRIYLRVLAGDEAQVAYDLLGIVHRLHSAQDAGLENIPDDCRWVGFRRAGYFEVFRRTEMTRSLD